MGSGGLSNKLVEIAKRFFEELSSADSGKSLENLRIKFLGKKSELTSLMRSMRELSAEERKAFGKESNELRQKLEDALSRRKQVIHKIEEENRLVSEAIDISLPSAGEKSAARHPLQQTVDLITRIFTGMGFSVEEGPEVEYVKYNFEMLRIPEGHPARDDSDSFYIDKDIMLRTQTSPVQVRTMLKKSPPFRMICPGRVYRADTADATHSPIFHQIEGMAVDKGVSMGDLIGCLKLFAKELFGENTEIRLRPHHFPFTEPSCEVDVSCWRCGGKGCPTCKGEGFVEILGGGMVHPEVLSLSGIDPEIYSGFAFGIGVERTAMAKFDVEDIRYFYENNLQFLKQFK